MERWQNCVAVVVGVGPGPVAAIAKDLVEAGLIVAAVALKKERMNEWRSKLPANLQLRMHLIECDVSNVHAVNKAFDGIEEHLGVVEILVNNAGTHSPVQTAPVFKANVMRVLHSTLRFIRSLKARNASGCVLIVNSYMGRVSEITPDFFLKGPTILPEFVLMELFRLEKEPLFTKLKFLSICPNPRLAIMDESGEGFYTLQPKHISGAILFMLASLPPMKKPLSLEKAPFPTVMCMEIMSEFIEFAFNLR